MAYFGLQFSALLRCAILCLFSLLFKQKTFCYFFFKLKSISSTNSAPPSHGDSAKLLSPWKKLRSLSRYLIKSFLMKNCRGEEQKGDVRKSCVLLEIDFQSTQPAVAISELKYVSGTVSQRKCKRFALQSLHICSNFIH